MSTRIMLTALLFYIFIKPLSYLPLPILHRIADFLFLVIYYIFPYRKKIVEAAILRSFPEKTNKERKAISKDFYRHFCDVMIEIIWQMSASKKALLKRIKVVNPELINHYYQQGRSVALTTGHCGNWEWMLAAMNPQIKHDVVAIYKPLSNAFFEDLMKKIRTQFGTEFIKKGDFKQQIKDLEDRTICLIFANDQAPSKRQKVHWMNFLNQETAVMLGAEIYSKRYDYVVIMMHTIRVKRGFYEIRFELVEEDVQNSALGEITAKHTQILEREIQKNPSNWLWTHKRWKRKRTEMEKMSLN